MPADCLKRVPLGFPVFQTATFIDALERPEVEEPSVL